MGETPASIPFAVSSGSLVTVNLIGNVIVCVVILRNKFMQTPVNYLLFNLAIADITVGLLSLPVRVLGPLYTHPGGTLGDWLCKLVTGDHVLYIGATVSALTLSFIAYERYQAVVNPFTAREKVTKRKVFIFIAIVWLVAFCIGIFYRVAQHFDVTANHCSQKSEFRKPAAIYTICTGGFIFATPFFFMLALYGRVIWELIRKQERTINRDQLVLRRLRTRITAMLVIVTVIFAATWGAGSIIIFVEGGYTPESVTAMICHVLVSVNSSLNCFLYTLFSTQFRQGLKNVFSACVKRRNNQPELNISAEVTPISTKQVDRNKSDKEEEEMDTKL